MVVSQVENRKLSGNQKTWWVPSSTANSVVLVFDKAWVFFLARDPRPPSQGQDPSDDSVVTLGQDLQSQRIYLGKPQLGQVNTIDFLSFCVPTLEPLAQMDACTCMPIHTTYFLVCMCTFLYTDLCIYMCIFAHKQVCVYKLTRTHMHTYTALHIRTFLKTYTHKQKGTWSDTPTLMFMTYSCCGRTSLKMAAIASFLLWMCLLPYLAKGKFYSILLGYLWKK